MNLKKMYILVVESIRAKQGRNQKTKSPGAFMRNQTRLHA